MQRFEPRGRKAYTFNDFHPYPSAPLQNYDYGPPNHGIEKPPVEDSPLHTIFPYRDKVENLRDISNFNYNYYDIPQTQKYGEPIFNLPDRNTRKTKLHRCEPAPVKPKPSTQFG